MGLTSLLKDKLLNDDPEKRVARKAEKEAEREHQKRVKEAYDKAFREEQLKAAIEQGRLAGSKVGVKKKGGLLKTIGNIAEGMVYGVNKAADTFNKGVGVNTLELPEQDMLTAPKGNNDLITMPKGNDDMLFGSRHSSKKRKYERY